jgi:hypothetical protein
VETGGFSDETLLNHNNWFGFRRNRRGLFSGLFGGGYCHYDDVATMLRDYRLWEQGVCQREGIETESAMRQYVETRYATDPRYAQKLAQAGVWLAQHHYITPLY